jgi:hypothetical protein
MEDFAQKYLNERIRFETEVLNVKRMQDTSLGWHLTVEDKNTGIREVLEFSRIVLCTGVRCHLLTFLFLVLTVSDCKGMQQPIHPAIAVPCQRRKRRLPRSSVTFQPVWYRSTPYPEPDPRISVFGQGRCVYRGRWRWKVSPRVSCSDVSIMATMAGANSSS